jgi:hypothetical protein
MIPPHPFPSWWHGNSNFFLDCIKQPEREAYSDLAALRLLWALRNFDPPPQFPQGLGCLWAWIRGLA